MKVKYRHIAYAEAEAESGVVEKIYDSDVSYMNNFVYNQNISPEEWAAIELKKFESDKQKGTILEYEVVEPGSMPPLLRLIKKVKFAELLEDTRTGRAVDQYFERRGWDLRIVRAIRSTAEEGYQVYFGKGVQVDNNFEYGFPCLYEKEDAIAFAGNFYMDMVLKEAAEICPMCGSRIEPKDSQYLGYGELSMSWHCEKCGNSGCAIINTYDNNTFERHEIN